MNTKSYSSLFTKLVCSPKIYPYLCDEPLNLINARADHRGLFFMASCEDYSVPLLYVRDIENTELLKSLDIEAEETAVQFGGESISDRTVTYRGIKDSNMYLIITDDHCKLSSTINIVDSRYIANNVLSRTKEHGKVFTGNYGCEDTMKPRKTWLHKLFDWFIKR